MVPENLDRAPDGSNARLMSYVGIEYRGNGERIRIGEEIGEECGGGACVQIGYVKYNRPVFPEIYVSLHIRSDDSLGLYPVVNGDNFGSASDSERIEAGIDFVLSRIHELGLDKS